MTEKKPNKTDPNCGTSYSAHDATLDQKRKREGGMFCCIMHWLLLFVLEAVYKPCLAYHFQEYKFGNG